MKRSSNYFQCFFDPIDSYKKMVMAFLVRYVKGDVLELGAGETPWFWALGYIQNSNSVLFTDRNQEYLDNFIDFIQSVDEDYFEQQSRETISFIRSITKRSITAQKSLEGLMNKTEVRKLDFSKPFNLEKQFDTVLSVESIECVDTKDEFEIAFQNVHNYLKQGGRFVCVALPYKVQDEKVEKLIKQGLEGRLNPDKNAFQEVATKVGFKNINIETRSTGKETYPEVLFITMQK